jgi:hypothetical protein
MKVNQSTINHAKAYGKANGHEQMFVTANEEVFTSLNLALNSVGGDKKRVAVVNIEPEVAEVIQEAVSEDEPIQEAAAAGDTTPGDEGTGTNDNAGAASTTEPQTGAGSTSGDGKATSQEATPAANAPAASGKGSKKA